MTIAIYRKRTIFDKRCNFPAYATFYLSFSVININDINDVI